jgi:pimeloyl-ACP methyl ester carboxylesterase
LAGLFVLLAAAGAISEQAARWHVWRDYPPPGRMVDIGGRRMQIDCRGKGSPTVVFESGAGPLGGLDWGKVQGPVAAFTRACSCSRAGELWSDPAGEKLTDERVAQDLHATLAAAGEKPPFVLVGHSLGGAYVATYTGLYPDDVAGLVLVSPAYPDQYARFPAIVGPEKAGFPQLRMLRIANALDWTGLTRRLFAPPVADPSLPPGVGAASLAWLFRTLPTLVDEYTQLPDLLLESGHYRKFGDRPVIVLSEGMSNTNRP